MKVKNEEGGMRRSAFDCLLLKAHKIYQFSVLLLLLSGCDRHTLLHTYQSIPNNEWNRSDTLLFTLPQAAADVCYTLHIGLRTTQLFPYQGVMLAVEQDCQHPTVHREDTVFYRLARPDGNIMSEGIHYSQSEAVNLPLQLQQGQSCQIRIRHLMQRETLPGIADVGIHVRH
jgi:gliding motility-associated lipoprotein GldH